VDVGLAGAGDRVVRAAPERGRDARTTGLAGAFDLIVSAEDDVGQAGSAGVSRRPIVMISPTRAIVVEDAAAESKRRGGPV
jgi:hypothetical protein